MSRFAVILPAAGASRRYGDRHYKKPFAPLAGRATWLHAADRFLGRDDVKQLIIAVADADREEFSRKFGANLAIMGVDVCHGGQRRADSVQNALAMLNDEIDHVAVHDAARPCIADRWIDAVFEAAETTGAAILAIPVAATLKRVDSSSRTVETVSRSDLWEAQTPQAFRRDLLETAYAKRGDLDSTDDAQLVEALGEPVAIVPGSPLNLKITVRDDLRLAEQILKILPKPKTGGTNPFADDDLWR
ncbi:2-C-methyl-D-erythritol 4-phosphate cytidylyltransferase [Pirellulales bacterium]|nr:2-C-methyl-D-erythritol 4-phosphate cytidylyltransferase [Pirellulales bacterium]